MISLKSKKGIFLQSDIKNRNKIALTDQFEKINQIDNAREISYFALSSKYSDIPEIDDEIFETCEDNRGQY